MYYRSSIYKGRSYSIHLLTTNETLAKSFFGYSPIESVKEFPTWGRVIRLFDKEFIHSLEKKVSENAIKVVKQNLIDKPHEPGKSFIKRLEDEFKDLFGTNPCYWGNISIEENEFDRTIENWIRYRFNDITSMCPDDHENKPLDKILHEGRVTRGQIVLPIDNGYEIRSEGRKYNIEDLSNTDSGTMNIYRVSDAVGKIHNLLSKDETIKDNKSDNSYEISDILEKGFAVFRDTWKVHIVQMEGALRVAARLISTTQLKRSQDKKKIHRKRKIKEHEVGQVWLWIADAIAEDCKLKIAKMEIKLPPFIKLSVSYYSSFSYKDKYIGFSTINDCIKREATVALAIWSMANKKQKLKAMYKMKGTYYFQGIMQNIKAWETSEHEEIRKLAKILHKANNLPEEVKNEQECTSSSEKAANGSNGSSPVSRAPVGIVIRTSRDRTRFCGGESSDSSPGTNTDNSNRAEEETQQGSV